MRIRAVLVLVVVAACETKSKPENAPAVTPSATQETPAPQAPAVVVTQAFKERSLFNDKDRKDLGMAGDTAPAAKASTSASANAPFSWKGRREFSWSGGKNPSSGATAVVTYAITVSDGQGGYDVRVAADGNQTMTRMSGGGVENGDSLTVGFKSCGQDDRFQCNGIHVGDTLFTLTHEPSGVWLTFGKMGAPDDKTKRLRASR